MDPPHVETEAWSLEIPSAVIGGPVRRVPEGLDSLALFHGWLGDHWVNVAVATRLRRGTTLRDETRRLGQWFVERRTDSERGDKVAVPGARDACRIDGLVEVGDEGDTTLQLATIVIAAGARQLVELTVRRPITGEHEGLEPAIETMIRSLTVHAA